MIWKPYAYQLHAVEHMWDNPYAGLFLDMGLGKTVSTLTYINRLIYQELETDKVLVIAPKNVTRTVWKQEAAKWDHLKHLKVSIVWGNVNQRIAALREKADVYVINRENLVWLIDLFQSKWPFRTVVIDELSSFKNHATQRFKALKLVRKHIRRLVGLTGTPAPNSLMDLWAPMYLLDEGARLEKTITGYRERYFAPEKVEGYVVHSYRLRKDAEQTIYNKISDICISMKAEDYLDMPDLIENDIWIDLDSKARATYDKFEMDNIMELAGKEITAMNAAALTNKLLQMANGAIYHEREEGKKQEYSIVHDEKLDMLEEIIDESFGKPVLVFYNYRHDLERILAKFPHARQFKNPEKDSVEWNEGKIPLMVLHPASAGHGLNLQYGGNIMIWYGLNWSYELYSQAIARLWRQGQKDSVILHRILTRDTMDEKVAKALDKKEASQDALMAAVKAMIDKYINANVLYM